MKAIISNTSVWAYETDVLKLALACQRALDISELKVLGFIEHKYSPQGYAALWLLAESHLSVHTFPERGISYIELSSFNPSKNFSFFEWLILPVMQNL